MTWSLQLSLWELPPLLSILLVLNDGTFLWPRRREQGVPALLALAGAVGAWALLNILAVASAALPVKVATARLEYAPAAVASAAWACFALVHTGRKPELKRWPMLLLYATAAASTGIALRPAWSRLLIEEASLVSLGGVMGLGIRHGAVHWLALATRFAAVLGGTAVLWPHLARTPGGRSGLAWSGAAALSALAPSVVQTVAAPGAEWADLSSTGYALGAALLVRGLVHERLLHLGPVDRDLVLAEMQDPIIVLDGRGRLVDTNRAARNELGLRPYGDIPVVLGTLWATGAEPSGAPAPWIVLKDAHGAARTYEVTLTRLGDSEQAGGRAALLLRDVTVRERMQRELERAYEDLERLARTDALTGLANRRRFMEALERELERSARYGRPLSLVAVDLDHFKSVNDTHGHAAGDEVLREAGRALRSVCRDVDLAARMGGEELALLLPETDAAGARIVAERARERIAGAAHRAPSGETFRVTASFGVAETGRGTSGDALLQAADEALYQAKGAGRNQVVVAL